MGRAKEAMMEWQALGCTSLGEKYICPDCVGDTALQQFIRDHAEHDVCDYCEQTFTESTCAQADELLKHIARSIAYEYEDPVHSVSYCSAEGGYLLPTMDSSDLLSHFDLGNFFDDAAGAFDGLWVEKDPYGDRPWEYLLSSWADFAEHVKYQQRFFFPRAPAGKDETPDASILETVANVVTEACMLKKLPIGTELFRARQHAPGRAPTTAIDLGTPPADRATFSNRMSPAGIPMFYAARDADTARAEIEAPDIVKTEMTTGRFVTQSELTVLDLADIPPVPSLFDDKLRHLRAGLRFIYGFAEELALPIQRNGQEHIEYVPTQMVSEYFRTIFKLPDGAALDGLVYGSVKRQYGTCVCLFFGYNDFAGTGTKTPSTPTLASSKTFSLSTPLPAITSHPVAIGATLPLL